MSRQFKFDSDLIRMTGAFNECRCTFMIFRSGKKLIAAFQIKKITPNVQAIRKVKIKIIHEFFFPMALGPHAGHGLPILEVSKSHTTTRHSR